MARIRFLLSSRMTGVMLVRSEGGRCAGRLGLWRFRLGDDGYGALEVAHEGAVLGGEDRPPRDDHDVERNVGTMMERFKRRRAQTAPHAITLRRMALALRHREADAQARLALG